MRAIVRADQRGNSREKSKNEYDRAYLAGHKWLEAVEWFGGPGIVIVFVLTGRHMKSMLSMGMCLYHP